MERELFERYEGNPILTPRMWPYPVEKVFNAAAVKYNNYVLVLARAMDRRNRSHLTLARSKDGRTDWQIDPNPVLEADISFGESISRLEDPRVVWVEELKQYIITCVSFRSEFVEKPSGITLLGTEDFSSFKRISQPLLPDNKNASLFPRKIKGYFVLIHRPKIEGRTYIAVSFSPDLIFWGKHLPLFSTRRYSWDDYRIGLGAQPIETSEGWLIIYHGSCGKADRLVYYVGLALLDLETLRVIRRSEEWIFGPEKDYEGGRDGIVFPCGAVVDEKTNKLKLYYGANDFDIALAEAKVEDILDYLMKCPEK